MTNQIKSILDWYKQFNKTDIVLRSKSQEFQIEINNNSLPHLLGLQYISRHRLKGYQLYNTVRKLSDEEVYSQISQNNPSMLPSVKERVSYFKQFMENIDHATLFEQTNTNSKIKSQYLLVQTEDKKFLQLGIGKESETKDFLETFIVRKDDLYFKQSSIQEEIIQVLKLDQDNYPVPFSFDLEKNRVLEEERRRRLEEIFYKDTDKDGLVDTLEQSFGTNPYAMDSDADGVTDIGEFGSGRDPKEPNKKEMLKQMISEASQEALQEDNFVSDRTLNNEKEL